MSFDPQTAGMVDERRDELYRSDPEFYNPVRRQLRQLRVRGRRKTPVINLGPSQLQELRALESSSSSRMGNGEGEGEVSVGAAAAAVSASADACEGAVNGGKEEEDREDIEIEEGQRPVGQGRWASRPGEGTHCDHQTDRQSLVACLIRPPCCRFVRAAV